MQKIIVFSIMLLAVSTVFAQQIDSIDMEQHRFRSIHWPEGSRAYLVYFQDSVAAPAHHLAIWKRTRTRSSEGAPMLVWDRSMENGTFVHYEIEAKPENLAPSDQRITLYRKDETGATQQTRKHFIYENGGMHTDTDTTQHQAAPVQLESLQASFNWEMDMEVFSLLPLAKGKQFAISFYHPGSSTAPAYYLYRVVGQEVVRFNGKPRKCWVLQIDYDGKGGAGFSDFWIDKKTKEVLKMRDRISRGGYRYKLLLPE